VTVRRGGAAGRPITLTGFGRPAATIRGRLVVADSANHVVVSNLVLDGRNRDSYPSPTVNGDDVVFDHDEVTNHHTAICFVLGSRDYGQAVDVVIHATAVHDCGTLPASNHEHGIYVEWADRTVITGNAITRNADRGVQLFPDAQHTLVIHNLIAGNGEGVILSGDDESASSDNVVAFNVITDSTIRHDVEEWWPGPVGESNAVTSN
jgi:putative cofactor-binding repeat protein